MPQQFGIRPSFRIRTLMNLLLVALHIAAALRHQFLCKTQRRTRGGI